MAVYYSRDMGFSKRFGGVVDEALWATMACGNGQALDMRLIRLPETGTGGSWRPR